jgi:putative spermidine/putrescine transport system substrate-binding protein
MKRIALATMFAAAFASMFTGPALGATPEPAHGADMVFVSFGGALQEAQRTAFLAPFMQTSGHKIGEQTWDGGIDKISVRARMGALDWDVVQLEGEDFVLGSREGLFERIDWDALGGREKYLPQAVAEYGVGAILYSVALGYDASRFASPPRSWTDFFDMKKFPGKRALRKTAKTTMEIALLADGVRPDEVYKVLATPEGQARAFRKLDQIKAGVVWWESGAKPVELLRDGKVTMAAAYNGRIAAAQAKGADKLKIQWEQNLFMRDWYAVLKNAKNPLLAKRFLRYINTPDVQARLPGLIPYGVPRMDVMHQYATEAHRDLPTHPANLRTALAVDDKFWVEHGAQLERVFDIYVQLFASDAEPSARFAQASDAPILSGSIK